MKLQPSLVLMIASVALLGPACSSRGPDDALSTTSEALTSAAGEATSGLVRTFLNVPATTLPDAQIAIQALENDGSWLCWGLTTDGQGMPMHGPITLGSCEGWINPSSGYYRNAGAFLRTVNFGDGTFELHAAAASGCVDIQDGPTGNGTLLRLADCNGTLRQRFSYVPVNASGGGTFGQFKHVASQKCIDTEWGGTAGTRLRLWECNKGTNGEAWRPNAGSLDFNRFQTGLPDGPFRFGASLSKYGSDLAVCMDVVNASSASGTPIQLWPCNTTSAQRFTVHNVGEGVFELNVLGKCVDIRNGAMADHTALQIWDCNGTPAQRFRWGQDLCTADRAFCIDRPNNTKANGTELQIYHRNATYAQGWNSELIEPPACSSDRCFVWPDKWGSYNGFTTAPLQQTGKGVNNVRFQMACTENEQTLHESRAVYRSPNGGVTWDPIGYWPEACLGTIRSFIDHDTPLIANDTGGTTTYQYRVLTVATWGTWANYKWSDPLSITLVRDTNRPAAPTITVTDQSATQITVSVKDNSTNEEGFKIYVKGPSDAAPILAITKPAQKPIPNVGTDYSFSFTLPAQEFQKYEFVATSFLTVNQQTLESDKTDPKANATAYAIKPPQPVYGVAIDSVTADSIHLVWSDAEPDVTQYTVTVSSPPDPSVEKVAYRLDYLATGLTTASKTYCFQVRAWKGPQSSPPSAPVCNPPLPNPK